VISDLLDGALKLGRNVAPLVKGAEEVAGPLIKGIENTIHIISWHFLNQDLKGHSHRKKIFECVRIKSLHFVCADGFKRYGAWYGPYTESPR
jgi:hypothetical protein